MFLIYLLFLGMASSIASGAENQVDIEKCQSQLVLTEFKKKLAIGVVDGKLKFSKEQIQFFDEQRQNLIRLVEAANDRYLEADHAIRRLILAELIGSHVYIEGGPGSAKTELANYMFQRLEYDSNGNLIPPNVFTIQLHQLLSDVPLTGFIDPAKLSKPNLTPEDIHNKGTMVYSPKVILDEVDKIHVGAAATLNDVTNERRKSYGPITIDVQTKNVVLTSNLDNYSFLKLFIDQGMAETGRALLGRIPFKVFMFEKLSTEQNTASLKEKGDQRASKSAEEKFLNPDLFFPTSTSDMKKHEQALNIPVLIEFLGSIAQKAFVAKNPFNRNAARLQKKIFQGYKQLRVESQVEVFEARSQGEDLAEYYPPMKFNNRENSKQITQTIKASLFLDLLLEKRIPSKALIQIIESQPELEDVSLWRLKEVAITAAAGDATLVVKNESANPEMTLEFGPELVEYMNEAFEPSMLRRIQTISKEREIFNSAFTETIQYKQKQSKRVSEILSSFLPNLSTENKAENLEEALYYLKNQ